MHLLWLLLTPVIPETRIKRGKESWMSFTAGMNTLNEPIQHEIYITNNKKSKNQIIYRFIVYQEKMLVMSLIPWVLGSQVVLSHHSTHAALWFHYSHPSLEAQEDHQALDDPGR